MEPLAMPLDLRRIAFSQQEILAAIQQFHMRTNRPFPTGNVENASVEMVETQCAFSCDVVRNGYREQVRLAGEALAAALIFYCISRKIPVPAKATKRLEITDGKLALVIRLLIEEGHGQAESLARPSNTAVPSVA
jgi:hypothetical protein